MQHINTIASNLVISTIWVAWLTGYISSEQHSLWEIIGIVFLMKIFSLLIPQHVTH